MALDNDKMLLREGYSTVKQLMRMADKDTDAVSAFVNGSDWTDATSAIYIVKGGDKAKEVFEMLEAKGLISRRGVVVNVDAIKVFALDDTEFWAGVSLDACLAEARKQTGDDCYLESGSQYELNDEAMTRMKYQDDDGTIRTFKEELRLLIEAGQAFPCPFAADE